MLNKVGVSFTIIKHANKLSDVKEPKNTIIDEKDSDFLYFTAIALHFDRPNGNGDLFPAEEGSKYGTFVGSPININHDRKKVVGEIVESYYVDKSKEKYIEIIGKIDRKEFPEICEKLEKGKIVSVSMEAQVEEAECSVCGKRACNSDEFCEHLKNLGKEANDGKGTKNVSINHRVTFVGCAIMDDILPADPDADIRRVAEKLDDPQKEVVIDNLVKGISKEKDLNKILEKLNALEYLCLQEKVESDMRKRATLELPKEAKVNKEALDYNKIWDTYKKDLLVAIQSQNVTEKKAVEDVITATMTLTGWAEADSRKLIEIGWAEIGKILPIPEIEEAPGEAPIAPLLKEEPSAEETIPEGGPELVVKEQELRTESNLQALYVESKNKERNRWIVLDKTLNKIVAKYYINDLKDENKLDPKYSAKVLEMYKSQPALKVVESNGAASIEADRVVLGVDKLASVFTKTEQIDLGDGYVANKDKSGEIVIVNEEGKEEQRLPDGFGDDVKAVTQLLRAFVGLKDTTKKKVKEVKDKEVDLEKHVQEKDKQLKEKDKAIEEKEVKLKETEHAKLEVAASLNKVAEQLKLKEAELKAKDEALQKTQAELNKLNEQLKAKQAKELLDKKLEKCKSIVEAMVERNMIKIDKDMLSKETSQGRDTLEVENELLGKAIDLKVNELLKHEDKVLDLLEKSVRDVPVNVSSTLDFPLFQKGEIVEKPSGWDQVFNRISTSRKFKKQLENN